MEKRLWKKPNIVKKKFKALKILWKAYFGSAIRYPIKTIGPNRYFVTRIFYYTHGQQGNLSIAYKNNREGPKK